MNFGISQLRICRPPSPQFWSRFIERWAMRWIYWKINFPIFIFRKKLQKSENRFFIRFSTFHIFHGNLNTLEILKKKKLNFSFWISKKIDFFFRIGKPSLNWLTSESGSHFLFKIEDLSLNWLASDSGLQKSLLCFAWDHMHQNKKIKFKSG